MSKELTVGMVFDSDTLQDAIAQAKTFDGDAGTLLPSQLRHIIKKIGTQRTKTETFMQLGINIDNEGGHAEIIEKIKVGYLGDFKRGGQGSNTDGEISLAVENDFIKTYLFEADSSWSIHQIKASDRGGINLASRLIVGHSVKLKTKLDKFGYIGEDANHGILTYTGFERTNSIKLAVDMTDNELYLAIKALLDRQIADNDDELFYADKLVTSTALAKRIRGSDYKDPLDKSIAKKIKETYEVDVVGTHYAQGIGAGDTDVMVALCTAEEAINFRLPVRHSVSPIQQDGFKYKFESYFRIAGCDFSEDVSHVLEGL